MAYPRAVLVERFGPPESHRLVEHDPGQPGPKEVRIRVKAAGVNFVDVLIASGSYQVKPQLPCVPGLECAGVIDAIGPDVEHLKIGDRVIGSQASGNGFSDYRITKADKTYVFPDEMSFAEAAVFKLNYTTAYYALKQRGALQAGETVVVMGASGGVGYSAIEIAKAMGAFVIASASTDEKRALAKQAGADAVIDSLANDWRDQVRAANHDRPVDVVVDPVGGNFTEPAFRSLGWKGRHLMIGFAAGSVPKLQTNLALLKGASLVGVDVHQLVYREPDVADQNLEELFELYKKDHFKPPVCHRFPIEKFAEAMNHVSKGKSVGRTILELD